MIPHDLFNGNVNLAQYSADLLNRQEVTVDWYLDNMIDQFIVNPSVLDLNGDGGDPVIYFVTKNGKDYWQTGAYV